MKPDWQLIGGLTALGVIMGYLICDAYLSYRIGCKNREIQKVSKYIGPFSFRRVDDANDGKLYFGDKPWKNLENRVKNN